MSSENYADKSGKARLPQMAAPVISGLLLALALLGFQAVFIPSQAWANEDPFAYEEGQSLKKQAEADRYPQSFDLRNVDGKSYVTPVRLQNPFGTCWGFAAIAAAESAILADETLGQGLDPEELDLSEKHLAYFVTTHLDDPANPQNGEGRHFIEEVKSSSDLYDTGGLVSFATSMFSSGVGPASEANFPYQGEKGEVTQKKVATAYDVEGKATKYEYKDVWYSDDDDWKLTEDDRFIAKYQLSESFILPSPAGRDQRLKYKYYPAGVAAIKDQMYNHKRAVSIAFSAESYLPGQDTSGKKYMSENWAHYTWDDGSANHAVTIVGWDDNYPKENFVEGHQPEGDGAFLIKNSWGSEVNSFPTNGYRHWGLLEGLDGVPYDPNARARSDRATGYFWISYYDHSLRNAETFDFEQATGEDGYYVEQHDYVCTSQYENIEEERTKMANVFTAEATSELTGISVVTTTPETRASYEIYLLGGEYSGPEDGVKIASGETSFQYGGYHRIQLPESQRKILSKNQNYSVIFTEETPSAASYVTLPLGQGEDGVTASLVGYYDKAVINKGESYLYMNGDWVDLSDRKLQKKIARDLPDYVVDNFPVKSYLEPVRIGDKVFDGYLTISNWSQGTPGAFELSPGDVITLSADFKGTKSGSASIETDIEWKSSDTSICSVTPKAGGSDADITALKEGTVYLSADAGNYGMRLIRIQVEKPHLESMMPGLDKDKPVMTYTGRELRPKLFVYPNVDEAVQEGVDYKVKYSNNTKCGTATVTVTAMGKYDGKNILHFTIVPAKAAVKSLTPSRGKLTVKVKKQKASGITGYKIQYKARGAKKWTSKRMPASRSAKALTGLQTGRTYQVRVCGYVKTKDGTFCGKWSKVKSAGVR